MKTKKKEFDEQVRKALEGVQPIYHPDQWKAFEGKLDAAETEDASELARFDSIIRKKTAELRPEYKKENWERMSRELDEVFSWKAKIVRFKVIETALMLTALWTVFNFYNNASFPASKKIITPVQGAAAESSSTPIKNNISLYGAPAGDENPATAQKKNQKHNPVSNNIYGFRKTDRTPAINGWRRRAGAPSAPGLKIAPSSSGKPIAGRSHDPSILSAPGFSAPADLIAADENIKNDVPKRKNDPSRLQNAPLSSDHNKRVDLSINRSRVIIPLERFGVDHSVSARQIQSEGTAGKPPQSETEIPLSAYNRNLDPLTILAPPLLPPDQIAASESKPFDQIVLPVTRIKTSKSFHISMFSAVNFDFANSFFRPIYKRKEMKPGFGAGASMGWRKGRWEWETGLGYSTKVYNPVNLTILSGSFNSGYTNEKQGEIELDMIHIPVNVKYHFPLSGKWDIYASAGASFNVSARTIDNKQFTDASSFDLSKPFAPISLYSDPAPLALVYTPGIFEANGSLQNNYYYTVNGGIGVEYRRNRRFSIFLQPDYYLHIGPRGIGQSADPDRINTFSFLIGTKVRL